MIHEQKERKEVTENASVTVKIDESDSTDNDFFILCINLGNDILSHQTDGRKKRPFDVFMHAHSVPKHNRTLNEVSKYNMVLPDSIARTSKEFLADDFCVVNYWYEQWIKFSNHFCLAVGVFATPIVSMKVREFFQHQKFLLTKNRPARVLR